MKIRIYYEDTDAAGIVYHANFIKFCERARSEVFFEKGLSPHTENDEFFVIKNIVCDFIKPSFLGDMLEVKTEIIKRKNSSLIFQHDIVREEELVFSAQIVLVYIKDHKSLKIPDEVFEILDK